MPVRIGVDVGGTFTKAVACDASSGDVVARASVPTSHASPKGVADGVVEVVRAVGERVHAQGAGPILLVAHSSTQAVNALLEGDTATVGILGIGRRPDLRRARKRTQVGEIAVAPGRSLKTVHGFIDGTHGVTRDAIKDALRRLQDAGATAVCISAAFGVDDPRVERDALEEAASLGLPVCAGHELTGLYGLELRTITSAINASILPTALATAAVVERAVRDDFGATPVLVMRGDGGAADIRSMRRQPLLTAFSGPAASVAGTLRHLSVCDGIVIEVGGTSTNVSVIKGGRPVLAYVRVLEHVTCARSIDVRVVGVAGGSLIRVGRRMGRMRIADVGPRSAHIAGLGYAAFASDPDIRDAVVETISPRPGDPEEYVVLRARDGRLWAPTVTCAANAAGAVATGSYARGDVAAARAAFDAVGAFLGVDGQEAARQVLALGSQKIDEVVTEIRRDHGLAHPVLVGLGGGAGALVPSLGRGVGLEWSIPPDAEVISSIGDALSLIRVEIERTVAGTDEDLVAIQDEVERTALAAGASGADLRVELTSIPEKRSVRAVALGSVALETDALPSDPNLPDEDLALTAKHVLGREARRVLRSEHYAVFDDGADAFVILDGRGSVALEGRGELLVGSGEEVAARLRDLVPRRTRRIGPIAVAPPMRILRGSRLIDLSLLSDPQRAVDAALAECARANGDRMMAVLCSDR